MKDVLQDPRQSHHVHISFTICTVHCVSRYMALHTGAGTTDAILPAIPILLELASHTDPGVASTAAQCLATLTEMFPQDAAAGMISGDGLLLMADALQPTNQGPAASQQEPEACATPAVSGSVVDASTVQDDGDADSLRQQHLLMSLVAACRFQPPVSIMAGTTHCHYTWQALHNAVRLNCCMLVWATSS